MTVNQNPVFKFNREMMLAVKVENIAESASKQDVVDLFNTLIGEVRRCDEAVESGRRVLVMTFSSYDAAKKALCMSGYTIAGVPLTVTPSSSGDSNHGGKQGRQSDDRRNLYVLGLPFDLTKPEFIEIFSRYGTVSHAVILATVDNASRRRGFVVMSTHSEARRAMDALSRKEIKGHTIDVSWAVVQRSQGFLDGGDRTSMLSSQSPCPSPPPFEFSVVRSNPPSGKVSMCSTPIPERAPLSLIAAHPASLLVVNLPSVLFSQLTDLYPLFCPYGDIKKLEIVDPDTASAPSGDISVIVEYANVAQARDARNALHGQMYSNNPVKVEFMQLDAGSAPFGSNLSNTKDVKAGLNPHAAPFIAPAGLPQDTVLAPVAQLYSHVNADQNRIAGAIPSGLLAVNPYALSPYATPGSLYTHLYVPIAGTIRPSSAPSPYVLIMHH
ncbi:uncharacterized protein LAESUDRAFT_739252 [Laetiporus sulphureus 93-53]|uniref:RRM domain-containing protein n=1 Tax=Laetiporus sulphureus 93-53 TaxID=1314785 RepID=A0A165BKB5_9APHY|nr:uncharacterized protein LAESUDRAFT_739252 [Laetiporus sulphureus 93-53]KZT01213.1 hypothetical protein LAESUDRAFT_739252 [Laetiporus sulphureus 93-53]